MRKTKRLKHLVEFALVWVIYAIANVLPTSVAVAGGGALGRLAYALWRRRRLIARANLEFCFPEADGEWVDEVGSLVTETRTVSATFDHMTYFGLLGDSHLGYVPVTLRGY